MTKVNINISDVTGSQTYKIGDFFFLPDEKELVMLAQVEYGAVAMICISSGNRWDTPVKYPYSFDTHTLIDADEITRFTMSRKWVHIKNVQIAANV